MANERRSGEERRMEPPACTVPCPPMKQETDKLQACLTEVKKEKLPTKLYYWSFGGLSVFVVVIIGGFLWALLQNQHKTDEAFLERLGDIRADVAVSAEKVSRVEKNIDQHLTYSLKKFDDINKRMNEIYKEQNSYIWRGDQK